MPCEDPRCDCQQITRDRNVTSRVDSAAPAKPKSAIVVAHGALGDACGLASRVRNLVESLLGSAGPIDVGASAAPSQDGALPSLADHAIGTSSSVGSAHLALDRLEAQLP